MSAFESSLSFYKCKIQSQPQGSKDFWKLTLAALSHLYYLDRFEPLSFAIQYPQTRKALGYGINDFKAIYKAYVTSRGVK